MKIKIPEPLGISWRRKDVSTAKSGIETLADGRIRCWIEHEMIHGVMPRMLVWWFSNLEGEVEIDGRKYDRYRVWHPEDHIFIEYTKRNADGTVGIGSIIHLAEMLNGNSKYLVHIHTEIIKLDETGYIHRPRMHGFQLAEMEYSFSPKNDGTVYCNSLTIGFKGVFGKILNPLIHKFVFDKDRGTAWIKHNVEEVGNFESFLPDLYAANTL